MRKENKTFNSPLFLSAGTVDETVYEERNKERRQSLQISCLGNEVEKMKLSNKNEEAIKKRDSISVVAEEKETGKQGTKSKHSKQNNLIL